MVEGPAEIPERYRRYFLEHTLPLAKRFVATFVRMAENPPMDLDKRERTQLSSLGKALSILRAGAAIDIESAATAAGVEPDILFLFEHGLTGGELMTVGGIQTLLEQVKEPLQQYYPDKKAYQTLVDTFPRTPSVEMANTNIGEVVHWTQQLKRISRLR